jgi:hypothetical protein
VVEDAAKIAAKKIYFGKNIVSLPQATHALQLFSNAPKNQGAGIFYTRVPIRANPTHLGWK